MDDFAARPANERNEVFMEAAARMASKPAIVEKDFWVTWILGRVFGEPDLRREFTFKGGTSLSKVYGLIERFSEDIDLVLDWGRFLGQIPEPGTSRTSIQGWCDTMNGLAANYLAETLLPQLIAALSPHCEVFLDPIDPHAINVRFPASFPDEYIRPEVKLEIGPLASREPSEERSITSYAAKEFGSLFKTPETTVRVIRAERTFWEKVTILHREAFRQDGRMPRRYSRHYYDLYCMLGSQVGANAETDFELLQEVAAFKDRFYYQKWARYDLAKSGTLRVLPPDNARDGLQQDYREMGEMLFGKMPAFEEIEERLRDFEQRFNDAADGAGEQAQR